MDIAGGLYVLGGVAFFVVMPVMVLAAKWRTLEPGVRRLLVSLYLVVVALLALLVWLIGRWSNGGPLS